MRVRHPWMSYSSEPPAHLALVIIGANDLTPFVTPQHAAAYLGLRRPCRRAALSLGAR